MREQDRQRIIREKLVRLRQSLVAPADSAIPTGFASLDRAIGTGGLPRGCLIEIFGPSSSGKSTLALQIAGHVLAARGSAAWIDAEHVFDPDQAKRFGLNLDSMPVVRPDSAEQAMEISRRLVESGALDLLVIDSAAALVPRLELEAGVGDSSPGLQGRVLASGLRKLRTAAVRYDSAVAILNQTRGRSRSLEGDDEISAGGPALKLYAAVRISLDAARGRQVRFRLLKNKAGAAFTEGRLCWQDGWRFAECP